MTAVPETSNELPVDDLPETEERRRAEATKARDDEFRRLVDATILSANRALEQSPHRCAGECGARTLRTGDRCTTCSDVLRLAKEREQRLIATRIPARLRWATFDAHELTLRVKDAGSIAKARAAATKGLDRLVLQGPAGVGKSVLATCVVRQLQDVIGQYCDTKFFDGFELAIARAHSGLGKEAPDVAAALAARVLAFDDIGAGKAGHHDATADVVFARHAAERPTVYTTGFSVDELRAKYGDGICRRIFEHAVVINMGATRSGK